MISAAEAALNERGWFHRTSGSLRARRLPKGDMERKALARMGRAMLGRWRAAVATGKAMADAH